MDDPLIAFLFAEELTHFVLAEHGFEMPTKSGVRKFKIRISKSRFNSVIGSCVLDIIRSNADTIRTSYEKLQERGVHTIEAFRFEATISTIFHFRDGYDPELFLNLSAMLIGLSVLYFKDGQEEMAIGASQVLAYVLNFYIYQAEFYPSRGWFDLAVLSQKIRRSLDVDKNNVDDENFIAGRDNKTVDVDNKTVDDDYNSVDVDNNSVDVDNNSVDVDNNSVDVDNNSVDADNNSVGVENNTEVVITYSVDVENNSVDVDNNSVDVDKNTVNVENGIADVENYTVDVKNYTVDVENNIIDVENNIIDVENNIIDVKSSLLDVDNMKNNFYKGTIKF